MLEETFEYLLTFRGKVVTVCTGAINHPFNMGQMQDYFVGIVESLNPEAMVLRHHITGGRAIIFLNKVISITEEQCLDPNDPNDKLLIEAMEKKRKGQAQPPKMEEAPPVAPAEPPEKPKPRPKPPLPPGVKFDKGQFVGPKGLGELSRFGKQAASNPRPE